MFYTNIAYHITEKQFQSIATDIAMRTGKSTRLNETLIKKLHSKCVNHGWPFSATVVLTNYFTKGEYPTEKWPTSIDVLEKRRAYFDARIAKELNT